MSNWEEDIPGLNLDEIKAARHIIAEYGFEQTPDEVARNGLATDALREWKGIILSLKYEIVQAGERLAEYRNADKETMRRVLREEMSRLAGEELDDRATMVWGDMIRIFADSCF